jgi:hypothetical protein
MKKIITPGIFLLALSLTAACTETDDTTPEGDEPPDVAECCVPDAPLEDEIVFDSFDAGRRARARFDWIRQIRSK